MKKEVGRVKNVKEWTKAGFLVHSGEIVRLTGTIFLPETRFHPTVRNSIAWQWKGFLIMLKHPAQQSLKQHKFQLFLSNSNSTATKYVSTHTSIHILGRRQHMHSNLPWLTIFLFTMSAFFMTLIAYFFEGLHFLHPRNTFLNFK